MLALRLARGAHPVVQLRRLLVTAASAGTGFLLLCTLGHALTHPDASTGSVLRLAWCVAPLTATVYFAVAVARTDPGTRPRPGLSAIGLGPGRLMAISALTTALYTTLGSTLALLFFLHSRSDLTGFPFGGDAADTLAADRSLPLPAALTLLTLVPAIASLTSAVVLRPQNGRPGRLSNTAQRDAGQHTADDAAVDLPSTRHKDARPAGIRARARARRGRTGSHALSEALARGAADSHASWSGAGQEADPSRATAPQPAPQSAPSGLPWGIAVLAAGLAVETYASRSGAALGLALPGGHASTPAGVLGGWMLTALGLILAGPGLTHLCGQLLQAVRPGALRLLAGRVLQEEARRIGRPLGVVCAVASGAYAMATLHSGARPDVGPLTTLGALLVTVCTVLTLVTAAVEARNARAETVEALLRLGAPTTVLRSAALLRAATLLAVFGPLTWTVAALAATPLTTTPLTP